MAMYLLYWGLLALWPLLLWPVFRLRGGARGWLLLVAAIAILATIYEIRMVLFTNASIRLDILFIGAVLVLLYGSAALILFSRGWRGTGTVLTAALAVTAGGLGLGLVEAGREGQRISEAFEEGNRLLFQAMFRDQPTYESHFGPFGGDHALLGHWQGDGQSRFTRMVVNGEGRVWLFYPCQTDAECHYGPEGSGLRKAAGDGWTATVNPSSGMPLDVTITMPDPDTVMVETAARGHRLQKASPPLGATLPAPSLAFLGSFRHVECIRAHAKVRQLWLWQEDGQPDGQPYAVGVFSTLVAGRENRFVHPVVLGPGAEADGGWRFEWTEEDGARAAEITVSGDDAVLRLDDGEPVTMEPGSVFSDPRIALAPLGTGADWTHWFDTVLVGHFLSGTVPDCPATTGG